MTASRPGYPLAHLPTAAAARVRELSAVTTASAEEVLSRVTAAARRQETAFARSLNLYAGTNILSPAVEAAHTHSLSVRPALGWPGQKVQPGLANTEEIEYVAASELARAFGAEFAEPRYLTATLANLGCYLALTTPGDAVAVLSPSAGGHASHWGETTLGVAGVRQVDLPYDSARLDVDVAALGPVLEREMPRLIVVGGSVILFPHDLAAIRACADRVGARVLFDASHVAGLIAGGRFPNPLAHGADVMTFSTYKTLGGPAGGAVVTNDPEVAMGVSRAIYPVLSSNYDAARLGPLAVAAAEAREQAPAWAQRTIEAAQVLARTLHDAGLPVVGADRGFTASHQVVVDAPDGDGAGLMKALEQAGVLAGACRVPGQEDSAPAAGIRLGTQEIVRLGATDAHLRQIAELFTEVYAGGGASGYGAGAGGRGGAGVSAGEHIRATFGPDIWGRTS